MKTVFSVAVVAFLLAVGSTRAGSLAPATISADAQWFGHINCEKIQSMQCYQDCSKSWSKKTGCLEKANKIASKIGLNPMHDILDVTVYATQYEGNVGVGIFHVRNLDQRKMLAFFKKEVPNHKTARHGERELYTWEAGHGSQKMLLTGAFVSDSAIVIGADIDHVRQALDVIDGQKPSLANDSPLLKGVSKRALFTSAAIDVPEKYSKTTKCPILRKCKGAFTQWSEKDGQLSGKYILVTESEKTAQSMKMIADGLRGMVQLHCSDIQPMKKILDGLRYKAKGEVFTLLWKANTDDIRDAVEEVMKRQYESRHQKKQKAGA